MADARCLLRVNGLRASLEVGGRERALDSSSPPTRPFLKWAGGKQWLAPLSPHLIPPDFDGAYYEPFLGGAALFLAAAPKAARLGDLNEELVTTHVAVRDSPDDVIRELARYRHDLDFFVAMRKKRPRTPVTIAARFIYLNKTAFNGLYRVNRRGDFNVPFGRYKNPTICPADRLREGSALLQSAEIEAADFESLTAGAKAGDFVYLDPPYITGHTNNGFLKYNAQLFSWDDQLRLAATARAMLNRGARVLITNASHPAVARLYTGFRRYDVERRTRIAGPSANRGWIREILLSSHPLFDFDAPLIS